MKDKHKQVKKFLTDKTLNFFDIFDQNPVSIGLFKLKGSLVKVNQNFINFFHYSKNTLNKLNFFDLFVNQEDKKDLIHKLSVLGLIDNYQVRLKINQKEIFWANLNIKKVKIAQEFYYLITIFDYTREKKAKEVLYRNEERYRALFSNMTLGFALYKMVKDKNNKVRDYAFVEINESFENIMDINKEKAGGHLLTQVIPNISKDSFNWLTMYDQFVLNKGNFKKEFFSQVFKKWFSISIYSPAKDYLVTLIEDITQKKEKEELIEQAKKDLELKVKELEKMNKLMIGRELKMLELKQKIRQLKFLFKKQKK